MSEHTHRLLAWMVDQDEETVRETEMMASLMGVEYTVSMLEQMGEDI